MKINYDDEIDAIYISFNNTEEFGFTYCCDPSIVDGMIHIDFDKNNKIIGIEVLNASSKYSSFWLDKYKKIHNKDKFNVKK